MVDNFINSFKDELNNRDKIDSKKNDILYDIINNLILSLNIDNDDKYCLDIIKQSYMKKIINILKEYIDTHVLSECKELLNADKCFTFLAEKNKKRNIQKFKKNLIDRIDIFSTKSILYKYDIQEIDDFIQGVINKKMINLPSQFGADWKADWKYINTMNFNNPTINHTIDLDYFWKHTYWDTE